VASEPLSVTYLLLWPLMCTTLGIGRIKGLVN
jgi:hypothetical protein